MRQTLRLNPIYNREGRGDKGRVMSVDVKEELGKKLVWKDIFRALNLHGIEVAKANFLQTKKGTDCQDFHLDYTNEDSIEWTASLVPFTMFIYLGKCGLDVKQTKIKRYFMSGKEKETDSPLRRIMADSGDIIVVRGDVEHRGIENPGDSGADRIVLLTRVVNGSPLLEPLEDAVNVTKYA